MFYLLEEFGVGTNISITCPIPVFWNREKLKPYPNPIKTEKIHQFRFSSSK